MIDWMRMHDGDYASLQKSLLAEPGGEAQLQLLSALCTAKDFVEYISDNVGFVGTAQPPTLPRQLTEHEYQNPPIDTEEALYSCWANVSPSFAARTTFWVAVTLHNVEQGLIEPTFLVAGGRYGSGRKRMEYATKSSLKTKKARGEVDRCVRDVLRRLGGLGERGVRSLYSNCPLARAWWREKFITECRASVSSLSDEDTRSIRTVFHYTAAHWEHLVTSIVCRNSVMGCATTRSAIMTCISRASQRINVSKPGTQITEKQVKQMIHLASLVAAQIELGSLSVEKIIAILEPIQSKV